MDEDEDEVVDETVPKAARGKGPRQVRTGDTLGRYELGDELGEGGMATVFRARDRDLRRDVALKVLFPHLARRAEIVRRFQREARAAAGLEHPNILRIYDVGGAEGDDPPYIVMELIRGRTLLQEIEQRGAMLTEIVACVGALLSDALAAAHAAGIIHRDIKPANVLIAPGGRLLLADFGVARLETDDSLVTRTGALLGTPAYMSPEQAAGEMADARSDLYSLGATLYQLATGALPYSGSPAKVMSMIATGGMVAPVRRRPACGVDLSRLIERLMAKNPQDRPANATEIAAELRALAATGGIGEATDELSAYFEDPDGCLRARIPAVVGALVVAARTAIAQSRLPRAMALADRASALSPTAPDVVALVEAVVDGGRARDLRRRLAVGALGVAILGGAIGVGWLLAAPPSPRDLASAPVAEAPRVIAGPEVLAVAPVDAAGPDRVALAPSDAVATPTIDAALAIAPPDAAVRGDAAVANGGAGSGGPRGAAPRVTPAAPLKIARAGARAPAARAGSAATEAPVRLAPDPAPRPTPPVDAPLAEAPRAPIPAPGRVIVRNDLWCTISIDGVDRGNSRNLPLEVAAGHHTVRCVNPVGEWTQQIDIAAGETRTVTGTLGALTVTLEIDATINGKSYARGERVKLKAGNFEVVAGGRKQFLVIRTSCTLRDLPDLGCYPR